MKKGFISMAVVYSFLIVFLIIMTSLLNVYINRNNFIDTLVKDVKNQLNEEFLQ